MRVDIFLGLLSMVLFCCSGDAPPKDKPITPEAPFVLDSKRAGKIATVGEYEIFRVALRSGATMKIEQMFLEATPEQTASLSKQFDKELIDNGMLIMAKQCFIVKGPDLLLLVSTAVGDGNRDKEPPFIKNLAAIGVKPTEVNYVFSTHFHMDHVGWSTRRLEMQLMPTFPNARYLYMQEEWDYWRENREAPKQVSQIFGFGLADLINDGYQLNDDIRIEKWAGHTPGHSVLRINSKGKQAIFCGDLMHHPLQCSEPGLDARFSVDREASIKTRKRFFKEVADNDILIIPAHFPYPCAGYIKSEGKSYIFDFLALSVRA